MLRTQTRKQLPTSTTRCQNLITFCLDSELTVYLRWKNPIQLTIQNLWCTSPVCHKYLFLFWGFHPIDFCVHWKWHPHGPALRAQACPGRALQLLLGYGWELDPRSWSPGWHLEFRFPLHGLEFHPIAEMGCAQESARDKTKSISISSCKIKHC